MPYHFFPMIARMRYISRWGLMRNTDPENVQEHSHRGAVLAHALAVIENERFSGQTDPGVVAVAAGNRKAGEAQRVLAHEACTGVHGADATAQAGAATSALWGRGDLADIDEATILAATADLASGDVAVGQTTIVDLLVGTGLERGRNAARKTIAGGGAYINNVKVADETAVIGPEHLLAGRVVLVRKGRRNLAVGRAV